MTKIINSQNAKQVWKTETKTVVIIIHTAIGKKTGLQMLEVLEYEGGFLIKKANSPSQIFFLSVWVLYIQVLPSRSISTVLVGTAFKGLRLQKLTFLK